MIHELKILPEHFEAWQRGEKTCELRKDDREPRFEAGDDLLLNELANITWSGVPVLGFTGRSITVRVLGVLRGHEGLAPGYCLMSCERMRHP